MLNFPRPLNFLFLHLLKIKEMVVTKDLKSNFLQGWCELIKGLLADDSLFLYPAEQTLGFSAEGREEWGGHEVGDTSDGERLTFLRRSFNGSNTAFSTTKHLPDFSQKLSWIKTSLDNGMKQINHFPTFLNLKVSVLF